MTDRKGIQSDRANTLLSKMVGLPSGTPCNTTNAECGVPMQAKDSFFSGSELRFGTHDTPSCVARVLPVRGFGSEDPLSSIR